MFIYIQMIFLVIAVSIDTFMAGLSCGGSKIRISHAKTALITLVCTGLLVVACAVGELIRSVTPDFFTNIVCFTVLFSLGAMKIFSRKKSEAVRTATVSETLFISVTMSIDGMSVGIGSGIIVTGWLYLILALMSLLITYASIVAGNRLGFSLSKKVSFNFNYISGGLFIILGIVNLAL